MFVVLLLRCCQSDVWQFLSHHVFVPLDKRCSVSELRQLLSIDWLRTSECASASLCKQPVACVVTAKSALLAKQCSDPARTSGHGGPRTGRRIGRIPRIRHGLSKLMSAL